MIFKFSKNDIIAAVGGRSTNGTRSYFYMVMFGQIQTLPTCNLINTRHNSNHCIQRTLTWKWNVSKKNAISIGIILINQLDLGVHRFRQTWTHSELRELRSQAICFPTPSLPSSCSNKVTGISRSAWVFPAFRAPFSKAHTLQRKNAPILRIGFSFPFFAASRSGRKSSWWIF